jgi:hypothetical protein
MHEMLPAQLGPPLHVQHASSCPRSQATRPGSTSPRTPPPPPAGGQISTGEGGSVFPPAPTATPSTVTIADALVGLSVGGAAPRGSRWPDWRRFLGWTRGWSAAVSFLSRFCFGRAVLAASLGAVAALSLESAPVGALASTKSEAGCPDVTGHRVG